MNALYNIFQNEKHNLKGDFSLYYNEIENLLMYFDHDKERWESDCLSVDFGERDGDETFYFRSANIEAYDIQNDANIIIALDQRINLGTKVGFMLDKGKYFEGNMSIVPDRFKNIIYRYQYARDDIGIDKEVTNDKEKSEDKKEKKKSKKRNSEKERE